MELKQKRTKAQNIKRLEKAIKKFGDSDGSKTKALKELKASS